MKRSLQKKNSTPSTKTYGTQAYNVPFIAPHRRFSGDEAFLTDPNAYNDTANTAKASIKTAKNGESEERSSRL